MDYNTFFKTDDDSPAVFSKHLLESNLQTGAGQPCGEVIFDVSETFEPIEDATPPRLVCLHITPMCGLVLVSRVKDDWGIRLFERIGLATGSNFEEWFTDLTCGPVEDGLVGII